MPDLEGRTFGNYHLIEKAGRGGMSNVYKAHDLVNDRTVAVKILAPHLNLDDSFKKRFIREAKVLSKLDHPNIIPVIDYGEVDGLMFIVMPFMKYGGLHLRIQKKPMNVREAVRIIDQICSALQYAHEHGVVHRDVKPSNILLDEEGNAYLSDFGFAHVTDASMSLTGSAVIGTPSYMAPEQLQNGEVTPHSDQYALAVVLYRMSTGHLPYDAETPIAIALKHATEPLPRPRYINPNLPEPIERVLIKALSKNPEMRYVSVNEFNYAFHRAVQEAIERVKRGITDEIPTERFTVPIEATVPMRIEEKKPWFRRRALALALLALLVCPLGILATNAIFPGLFNGGDAVAAVPTVDVQATLDAFATDIVAREGGGLSSEEIQALLDATLTAQGGLPGVDEGTPTEPVPEDLLTGTATPTLGSTLALTDSLVVVPVGGSPTPTRTSAATAPPGSSPTSTPPPTNTPTITATPTGTPPPPTDTPPPPTATTENVCANLSLSGKTVSNKKVFWYFNNNSSVTVTINFVELAWPGDDNEMKNIKVGDNNYASDDTTSPTSLSGLSVGVASGSSAIVEFNFVNTAAASSYSLTVKTTNGCTK